MNFAFLVLAAFLVRATIRRRVGDALAKVVAAVTLVYPPFLTSTALVLQEVLLAFQVALLYWALWRAVEHGTIRASAVAGVAFALAALGKPTVLLSGPFLLVIYTQGRPRTRRALSFLLASGLVLGGWAVRNRIEIGRFELAPGNAGHAFLGGTVSNEIDGWYTFPEYLAAVDQWKAGGQLLQPSLDRYLGGLALQRITPDPAHWLALCAGRAARFMLPARTWFVQVGLSRTGTFSPIYLAATAFNVVLFGLAGWLMLRSMAQRDACLALGPILIFTHQLVYSITYVSPRYALTVGPVLMASAALAIDGGRRSLAVGGTRPP